MPPAGGCAPHTPIPDEPALRAALAHPPTLGFPSVGAAPPRPHWIGSTTRSYRGRSGALPLAREGAPTRNYTKVSPRGERVGVRVQLCRRQIQGRSEVRSRIQGEGAAHPGSRKGAREAPRFGDGTREPCRRRRVPGVRGLASSGDPSGVSWPAPASTGWKDSRGIRAPRRTPCSGPAPRPLKALRASSDGRGSCRSHPSPLMSSVPPSHDASARQSADHGTRTPEAHAARASGSFRRIVPHRVQSPQRLSNNCICRADELCTNTLPE